jgi:hypothetical protein
VVVAAGVGLVAAVRVAGVAAGWEAEGAEAEVTAPAAAPVVVAARAVVVARAEVVAPAAVVAAGLVADSDNAKHVVVSGAPF